MKKKMNLEYRMYGLVPYQLSGIQKGIQFGHAVVEYGNKYSTTEEYKQWSIKDKTFIILNGGTTSLKTSIEDGLPFGSLNKHLLTLHENKIKVIPFYEPDLGDQLSGVCFLVDERVFNTYKYPLPLEDFDVDWTIGIEKKELKKILFLREFLPKFKLA